MGRCGEVDDPEVRRPAQESVFATALPRKRPCKHRPADAPNPVAQLSFPASLTPGILATNEAESLPGGGVVGDGLRNLFLF
jgi:hypothetical protein